MASGSVCPGLVQRFRHEKREVWGRQREALGAVSQGGAVRGTRQGEASPTPHRYFRSWHVGKDRRVTVMAEDGVVIPALPRRLGCGVGRVSLPELHLPDGRRCWSSTARTAGRRLSRSVPHWIPADQVRPHIGPCGCCQSAAVQAEHLGCGPGVSIEILLPSLLFATTLCHVPVDARPGGP